ncbi:MULTISPECIES: NADH-quinone oxidoreductase subunit D-related protein [Commensalibacter]|uniref:Ni Fe-hydrogenase III large subunit-like protein n=2 Tax=Commensalibacter TaxID=1079922 RepID=W7DLS4_9PROT|nr:MULTISPECIES: hypothetical protein [Commensalibacter]EUK18252.1 Ni Fe-hydrogenase III large subunit-like protein [Commensalibacter papalotli (ex Servin-Garciduenas et al. 2014)]CAI3936877.1 Fe-hydrogenase III large subunit (HycE2) (PDB:6CFW) [Commensalibacter papalotli (ex Botero et al. 2024)]CAI3938759.1 Fe-hydrogenase III large subunit (HycE2) (PDB:6CFW) [Commensalibacter papalotli (ex Botero et al. 2024)]
MTQSETSFVTHSKAVDLIKKHKRETKFFFRVEEEEWREIVSKLPMDRLIFLAMWCSGEDINVLFLENGFRPLGVKVAFSVDRYLAISQIRPAAIIYERMIWELWGKEAMNAKDLRPWLDRGMWKHTWPLSIKQGPVCWPPEPYDYEMPFDLIQKGGEFAVIDPSSCDGFSPSLWRFAMMGERIIKAESLYGYTHRSILSNLSDKNILDVLPKISRINAVDSVAHQIAFSHAIEDIAEFMPTVDVLRKRVILSELSKVNAHLLYLSKIFRDLNIGIIASRCELARELLMRWSAHYYGHRWLMDCVFPGAVRSLEEIGEGSAEKLPEKVKYLCAEAFKLMHGFPGLMDSLQGIGVLSTEQAIAYNIGGIIGRSSGRDIDIRRYMPEYRLEWLSPRNYTSGDVYARMQLRFQEIQSALHIIETILQDVEEASPVEEKKIIIETLYGEGIGVCEGVQGDLWYYVKVEAGIIKDIFIRDPASNQAYVLQGLLEGELWENQSIIRSSFGILSTGVDL